MVVLELKIFKQQTLTKHRQSFVSNHREVARESLIRIRYQENAEVIKAASHVASKVRNTELKKRAAHQEVTKCSPRKCHIGRILGAEEIEQ